MNFGQRGRALVSECHHSDATTLLPYNDELVKGCLEEITFHVDELTHLVESIDGEKPSLQVRPSLMLHDAAIRRNKRCLLAYIYHRVKHLQRECNSNNKHHHRDESVAKSLLHESEIDFLQAYERLRAQQGSDIGANMTCQHRMPPTHTWIQVRVLESLGTIVLAETGGTANLEEGTLHFLPAQDVESFIQQGYLEHVEGEEAF
jgi:GINS complex subunit 1